METDERVTQYQVVQFPDCIVAFGTTSRWRECVSFVTVNASTKTVTMTEWQVLDSPG